MPGGLCRGRLPSEAMPRGNSLPRRQQRLETAAPGPGPDGDSPRTPLFPSVETDVCLWLLASLAPSSHMTAGAGCVAGGSHFDFLRFSFLLQNWNTCLPTLLQKLIGIRYGPGARPQKALNPD